MLFKALGFLLAMVLVGSTWLKADEPVAAGATAPRMSIAELARWIDERFAAAWTQARIEPPEVVDDATFLKRTYLDLTGSIPSVSQARDYLEYTGERRRDTLVDRLLNDPKRP